MRLVVVASVLSFLAAAATFACSSSDPAAGSADAGRDAKAVVKSSGDDDDDTTKTDPPVTDAGTGDPDADAGPAVDPNTDAGHACTAGSTPEKEPNNDEATAQTLTPNAAGAISFCGQVATGDTDVFTFAHPFNGGFQINPSGSQVNYTTKIGDQTFNGFPQNATVNAGDKWVITVTSNSQTGRSYAVEIVPN